MVRKASAAQAAEKPKHTKKRVRTDQRTRAVLRVGDGRGFVVNLGREGRAVITAAHCLPCLPPCHPAASSKERTYPALLGALGSEPTVAAECLFADPIADIAVLGAPDNQVLSDEADAYERLLESAQPLLIANAPAQGCEQLTFGDQHVWHNTPGQGSVRLLSLDGRWVKAGVERRNGWLSIEPQRLVVSGMSGSPIVSTAGNAIGVVSVTHLSPVLMDSLSVRIWRTITAAADAKGR
jgi:hypothetical protein